MAILLGSGALIFCGLNGWVLWKGCPLIIEDPKLIPPGRIGVILGTSPSGRGQAANPFFEGRMNAAAALYHSGAVYHLVLSGDNRRADYNEPYAMRDALRSRGVPPSAITLDYAGFRTLDSVIRAHRVFQLQNPLFITDDFHLPRTLFIAQSDGMQASGFASNSVPWERSYRTRFREWLSRIRAWSDVYLTHTQPHFLGQPILLPNPPVSNSSEPMNLPQTNPSSAPSQTPAR